jgi:hypothetical protein
MGAAQGSGYAQLSERCLWDGRRSSIDPQDSSYPATSTPALPHGYKLEIAADRLSRDGGSLDAFI